MADRQHLIDQFLAQAGWGGAERRRLAGDASFRHYDRVHLGDRQAVLMDAPPPKEDVRPFVRIARQLTSLGFSAPEILAADEEAGFLLLEDLGDSTYTRLLAHGHDELALYTLAIDALAALHKLGQAAIPAGLPPYDAERLLTEALLLTDWYMPEVLGAPTSPVARESYVEIWRKLIPTARAVPSTMVLRDFHVDNLLLLDRPGIRACGLLDFQDAVDGPITYDLMSLLEDARRDIDPGMIHELRARYLTSFPGLDRAAFDASWAILAAQRHAKVIGIFTRLCVRDGKPNYLVHIPRVWRLMVNACRHPALAELAAWLDDNIPADKRVIPVVTK